ncbi:fasciclin domain-containing protein [Phormidium tenue FACHB-886]|nr:fasciclin domain-containing protein [Phormidium tenue FACHB-886]
MNLQSSVFRKATIGLVSGVTLAVLAACSGPTETTSQAPTTSDSPVAESPTTTESPVTTAESPAGTSAGGTVVEVASSNSDFSTLTSALQAAGLTETLSQGGPYTVFAPTNEAFNALPPETLQALLRPENKDALTRILTYHVVPQEVASTEISSGEVPTVEGKPVTAEVDTASSSVKVNDATVTQPDIAASNGVIHAIDKVLLPPDFDPTQLK